jgi:hypothetical protein
MTRIMTASWFARLPANGAPVGISRGVPRGRVGYRRMRELEPGPWFKSVSPARYLTLYREILDRLDPRNIRDRLLGYGDLSVMLCWETASDCHHGTKWCHRHLVAQWLEDRLGIEVREVGYPDLDRFAFLRKNGIPAPRYQDRPASAAAMDRIR